MAYCCLILFGKLIQHIVFGHLRVVEQQVLSVNPFNKICYFFLSCAEIVPVFYVQ